MEADFYEPPTSPGLANVLNGGSRLLQNILPAGIVPDVALRPSP